MRWNDERESDNVVDARGGGGGGGFPGGAVGVSGIGGVVVVVLGLLFGFDPSVILSQLGGGENTPPYRDQQREPSQSRDQPRGRNPDARQADASDPLRKFVSVVLASTEDSWTNVFRQAGRTYQEPKLVLFSGSVRSACGQASSAVGPFYCPGDRQVYLDLSFFRDMTNKLGAPGDFAQAYVIAHEVGHHVQTLLGITQRADEARRRGGGSAANEISVRIELQADCFAGVWANQAQQARLILEKGDIEEGIGAAAAVGDDRLQRRGQGYVVPESFTHGSSTQRVRWFRRGLETGQVTQCDTFKTDRL
jgi:predicted metalloprotease